ncbi:imipenem/basic amino acid-specific outer membrane pore [Atopomonas hussainii]|uniref:Imipenem/basic amino acid-specific outer membrane pore n=1 Tax=Atopomonas hussainii TaxID=1429083 RepID=A0A1H7SLG1_9GAMM|nr:OprD family porin [Atopomonas hussainii]SEL73343.1 imipenem/basic amino acid-specific outer membrane pore [Atopomonas hussainii]
MQMIKWSAIAVAVAAATSSVAMANQADSKGFVEDSSLTVLNRNYYFNRDFRDKANSAGTGDNGYREEWAHGIITNYESGFTQGTVGFGIDAQAFVGLKLDSGKGRYGSGLLPKGSDGSAQDSYGEVHGALKVRVSDTVLKWGEMYTTAPVFDTGDSRLLPETATGFNLHSNEIEGLALEAGHFTAGNGQASTNSDGPLSTNYGDNEAANMDFVGGFYSFNDNLSAGLYASKAEDLWNQYYGNVNYNLPLADEQNLNFDFNIYRTTDEGKKLEGDISNTTFSLAAAYTIGAHKFTLAHQRVNGDTPFDYIGGDSIWLSNSVQYSDFNAPEERSYQVRYDLNMAAFGVPGLSFMTRYTTGDNIDGTKADASGSYAGDYGKNGKHWERDIEAKYVVQDGAAKDLSFRVRQATHRANAAQGEGDIDEVRVIVEYPLSIL